MNLKYFDVPCLNFHICTDNKWDVAYYLESEEDYNLALFEFCKKCGISVGKWIPQDKSVIDDFELFKNELNNNVHILCEKSQKFEDSDWYIFKRISKIETYLNYDNLESISMKYQIYVTTRNLIKNKMKYYIALFETADKNKDMMICN